MRQGSKRMLFAVLILGLSGCTVPAGPPRYLVTVPTDTQLSCDDLWATRKQVAATAIAAYQNGNYDAALDLGLRLKWIKGLYKGKGCEEEERMVCLTADSIARQQTGYSFEELVGMRSFRGETPYPGEVSPYGFIKRCRELGAW